MAALTDAAFLRAAFNALDPLYRGQAFTEILEAQAEAKPDYWLTPITNTDAADLLGMSPTALEKARQRGDGPPGWTLIAGVGGRYPSRLAVLRWAHDQLGAEPEPKRRLTAVPPSRIMARAS